MLDQLINVIKDQAVDHFVNKSEVPNEQAEQAAEVTGQSILEGLTEQLKDGNITEITDLLNGRSSDLSSNPMVKNIMENLSGKLGNQFGLENNSAEQAGSVLPGLMENVIGKFMSPKKEDAAFNVNDLVNQVAGDAVKDKMNDMLGDALGNIFGGKK